ncbi:MAG: bifunctional folylpolyglutamate synthase/dihydrofolate synthase [Firmicutes bacterium HGW-Firmicutes-1]|jgi:dihydrofolate synthase/folylpolyglutamate synthase|nr:MAG: bifunctional folylpolyglutamate synthase/dihydrofolate synthase [Firmicutes bacterium HGW-Firmicutes-1]
MNYAECIEYILSIPLFSKKSGHKNIVELLFRLGNPHLQLKYIHVAGTNGKGSVCTMLSYAYVEANLKVGLFTSPHLVKINERIKMNNDDISDVDFMNTFHRVKKVIDEMEEAGFHHPSYFETLFVIAILYFLDKQVELVVLETGLGGRLDATNIIEHPLVTVITQIGLDHIEVLGDTIEKIAIEKGGIIKEGCPTVISSQEDNVLSVIRQICNEKNSKLYEIMPLKHRIIKRTDKSIDFCINNKYYYYDKISLNTCATYQIINVATALNTVEVLRDQYPISVEAIERAFQKFYWPGRMELINDWIVVDGAHNESGVKSFVENIQECFSDRKITILFTAMKDKAYDLMVQELSRCTNIENIVLTKVKDDRCLEFDLMKSSFQKYGFHNIEIEIDIEKAIKKNYKREDRLLCCVGSLYLVGEIKKIVAGGLLND